MEILQHIVVITVTFTKKQNVSVQTNIGLPSDYDIL